MGVGIRALVVLDQALHGDRARGVVGDDREIVDADDPEHQGRENAGAVLAHAAVEHRGVCVGIGQDHECGRDRARALIQHAAVLVGDNRGVDPLGQLVRVGQDVDHRQVVLDDVSEHGGVPTAVLRLLHGP